MMTRQAWINVSGVQWKLQIFFWDLPCYIMRAHANHSASASSSLPSRTKNYYGRGTTMCSPNLLPLPGHTGRWHSQHPLQFGWDHTISGAFILASPHPRPSFFQAIGVGSEMKSNNGGNLGHSLEEQLSSQESFQIRTIDRHYTLCEQVIQLYCVKSLRWGLLLAWHIQL